VFRRCNRAAAAAAYTPSSRFFERKARFDLDLNDFAIIDILTCCMVVVGGGERNGKNVALSAKIKKIFNRSLTVAVQPVMSRL
jgi:hypothetical protein